MSAFMKNLITLKLKQLTPDELIHHAKQYGFSVNNKQAKQIVTYIRNNPIDPFKVSDREKMVRELQRITDSQTAQNANKLFQNIIKENGLEHLFN